MTDSPVHNNFERDLPVELRRMGMDFVDAMMPEKPEEKAVKKAPFTFEDIFDSSLRPRGFDGRWISGKPNS